MEAFIYGFLTSCVILAIINKSRKRVKLKRILFRQSLLHHIIKGVLPTNAELNSQKKRQSKLHQGAGIVKVVQTPDSKAYWIEDNIFYCADVVDGHFDPSAGKPVDTSNMSKKEMNKLLFILDNLNSQNG